MSEEKTAPECKLPSCDDYIFSRECRENIINHECLRFKDLSELDKLGVSDEAPKTTAKGKAGRVYRLTPKAENLMPIAERFMRELEKAKNPIRCKYKKCTLQCDIRKRGRICIQ